MALPAPLGTASSSGSMNAEMNVTPMLDVLLVLLIIFMAALSKRMILDAHLPDPVPAVDRSEAVPIVLEGGRTWVLRCEPTDHPDGLAFCPAHGALHGPARQADHPSRSARRHLPGGAPCHGCCERCGRHGHRSRFPSRDGRTWSGVATGGAR